MMENKEDLRVNKKKILILSSIILIIICVGFLFVKYESTKAYSIEINGHNVGVIQNKAQINKILNKINSIKEEKYGQKVKPKVNINYEELKGFDVEPTPPKKLEEKIKQVIEYNVKAASIFVNGERVLCVKSREIANKVMEEIKASFVTEEDENTELQEVKFSEDVEIKTEFVPPEEVLDKKDAVNTLLTGTNEIKVHKVKKGECLWTIATKNRMSVSEIKKANPQLKSELLQVGQKINLVVPKPYLNVETKERIKYTKAIPYDVKIERDDSLWSWQSRVKRRGEYGVKQIEAIVTKKNGVEIGRKILNEEIIKEPKPKIVIRGTKSAPSRGTGRFVWPVQGRITSPYGWRWTSFGKDFHKGVDIAAPTGSPVKAADSGTVTFRSWGGGYGRLIIIDHGNGYSTYYAHLSSYGVKVGQAVKKGQVIGRLGNSGRSTGPHTHFEIRKNGNTVNPLNYFSK